MRPIWTISWSTFREYIRNRWIWTFFFLGLFIIFMSLFLSGLSFDSSRILTHLGLASIHLTLLGMIFLLGNSSLQIEMERQTIFMVLYRPVERYQFLFGKWLGILWLCLLTWGMNVFLLYLLLGNATSKLHLFIISLGILLEACILLSLSFFLHSFLKTSYSFFLSLGIFLAGNTLTDILNFSKKTLSPVLKFWSFLLYVLTPHLEDFNYRSYAYLSQGVPIENVKWMLIHAAGWSALYLTLAALVFSRRDIL